MATTNITITITTPVGVSINDAIDFFARRNKYQDLVNDGFGNLVPNLETKSQFCKRRIAEHVSDAIRSQQVEDARQVAQAAELAKPSISVE